MGRVQKGLFGLILCPHGGALHIVCAAPGRGSLLVFQDSGLLSVITDPIHTPVTLFWPTDQALQALPSEQQEFLFNQDNKDKLREYLKFHVIRDSKVFCLHAQVSEGISQGMVQPRPEALGPSSSWCVLWP